MTKVRRPLTPYRALSRVADLLGWDGCAVVIGKSEWTVRKLGDPDTGRHISLQDAIRLDLAYSRAGGAGAPLFEAYAAAIDFIDEDPQARAAAVLLASGNAAKETGEALAAALAAAATTRDPAARGRAIVEVEEGLEALQTLLVSLKQGSPE